MPMRTAENWIDGLTRRGTGAPPREGGILMRAIVGCVGFACLQVDVGAVRSINNELRHLGPEDSGYPVLDRSELAMWRTALIKLVWWNRQWRGGAA